MEQQTKIKQKSAVKITARNYDKFIVENNKLVDSRTGEIIDDMTAIVKYHDITSELERNPNRLFYFNNWLKGNKFSKLYQIKMRGYTNTISLQGNGLLFILMLYLKPGSNIVMIENKNPTNQQLADLTDIGSEKIRKLIAELAKVNLIKTIGSGSKREIFVNPYLCFNGKNLLKPTLKLFYPDDK